MTAVAAPARRRAVAPPRRRSAPPAARPALRVAPARARSGHLGTLMVVAVLFALVSAVVFHVMLAQNQLQLDRLNSQIAAEQQRYEQRRLTVSELSAPQRIIQEAERLGLILPAQPPQYLFVPGAPPLASDAGATATTTLPDWMKAKPSLGSQQP
jgi:cell division protein FtsL